MANEIQADCASGNVLYAVIRDRQGQAWYPLGQTFETWGTEGHTADDYDIPLTGRGGCRYTGDFSTTIAAGCYCIQVFRQAGASPAETDPLVCSRDIIWTGTGELTPAKMLANKAVQDTVTRAVDYYDDDRQTVLLTHTLHDTVSTSTRTPE